MVASSCRNLFAGSLSFLAGELFSQKLNSVRSPQFAAQLVAYCAASPPYEDSQLPAAASFSGAASPELLGSQWHAFRPLFNPVPLLGPLRLGFSPKSNPFCGEHQHPAYCSQLVCLVGLGHGCLQHLCHLCKCLEECAHMVLQLTLRTKGFSEATLQGIPRPLQLKSGRVPLKSSDAATFC